MIRKAMLGDPTSKCVKSGTICYMRWEMIPQCINQYSPITSPCACFTTKNASSPNFPGLTFSKLLFFGKPLTADRNLNFFLWLESVAKASTSTLFELEVEVEVCGGGVACPPVVTVYMPFATTLEKSRPYTNTLCIFRFLSESHGRVAWPTSYITPAAHTKHAMSRTKTTIT